MKTGIVTSFDKETGKGTVVVENESFSLLYSNAYIFELSYPQPAMYFKTKVIKGEKRYVRIPEINEEIIIELSGTKENLYIEKWGLKSAYDRLLEKINNINDEKIVELIESNSIIPRTYRIMQTAGGYHDNPEPKILWQGNSMENLLKVYPVSARYSADPLIPYYSLEDADYVTRTWFEMDYGKGWQKCKDPRHKNI